MVESPRTPGSWPGWLAALSAVEAAGVVAWLASTPADPKNAVLLGYSGPRLVLLAVALAAFAGTAWLAIGLARSPALRMSLATRLSRRRIHLILLTLGSLVLAVGTATLLLPAYRLGPSAAAYARLLPLVVLATLYAAQALAAVWSVNGGRLHSEGLTRRVDLRIGVAVFGGLVLLGALLVGTGLGFVPDRSGWYAPGTPILFAQLVMAVVLAAILTTLGGMLSAHLPTSGRRPRGERAAVLMLCLVLWLSAVVVWGAEPMRDESYFTSAPEPPNFELYPYSDAALYDELAQNVLVGSSRHVGLLLHPLYVFFLAALHAVAGQAYAQVVVLQVIFLALVPVLGFLIGSEMSGRFAGLVVGLLMLLRERNSIALTNVIEVSHSKLFMSDVPALVVVLVLVLVLLRWARPGGNRPHLGLIAGGVLGALVLIRSQALVLMPVVVGAAALAQRALGRSALRSAGLMLVGSALIVTPWLVRNHAISGRLVIDNTEFYTRFLASSYHAPDQSIEMVAGEGFDAYYARMRRQMFGYIVTHPLDVARFVGSHFIHNETHSLIYLPLGPWLHDLRGYVASWDFWSTPRAPVPPTAALWLPITVALVSLGLGASTARRGIAALLPLAVHLGYSLSVAPARLSGWRFILPVDWITLLYYSIGIVVTLALLRQLLTGKVAPLAVASEPRHDALSVARAEAWQPSPGPVLACLLGAGLLVPGIELLAPTRYPALAPSEKLERHLDTSALDELGIPLTASDLKHFAASDDAAAVLYGRALYPAYYRRGKFWGDDTDFVLAASASNRLQFAMTGGDRTSVYLPLLDPPDAFPHAVDALVLGCREDGYVRALLVFPSGGDPLAAGPWPGLTCAAAAD